MLVGTLRVEFLVHGACSLKEKRFIIQSIKDRMRNHFNCSVAEVEYQDKWQRGMLGLAMVSNNRRFLDSAMQKMLNKMHDDHRIEVIDQLIEVL